jgi:O-antigen ligase
MSHWTHRSRLLQFQNLQELLEILLSSRITVTPYVLPYQLLLYTPFVYLAYLARREGTYALRLLILPVVLSCIFFSGWGFVWTEEDLQLRNWGQSECANLLGESFSKLTKI